ncbi:MAG: hypothetical protein DI596_06250 [Azospira oryzae]|uniref:Uncharacterized protein n=1 Tax=Pelomicrobium methylotrophicum TaxID=2602750 RepID=A0A5C7EHT0_9PROT|nr:MAG: hypothetical protein DI596_06250 [Azospira oryzae]PZP80508.1 MAG: hypothetical protein DI593_06250 [Azospira oryzae]TXF10898.1 hypothetical protein FR698_13195 [Pelomicrobium methylotrophicum]
MAGSGLGSGLGCGFGSGVGWSFGAGAGSGFGSPSGAGCGGRLAQSSASTGVGRSARQFTPTMRNTRNSRCTPKAIRAARSFPGSLSAAM